MNNFEGCDKCRVCMHCKKLKHCQYVSEEHGNSCSDCSSRDYDNRCGRCGNPVYRSNPSKALYEDHKECVEEMLMSLLVNRDIYSTFEMRKW